MTRTARILLAVALAVILAGGAVVLLRSTERFNRTHVVAYFENSNGIYAGDDVRIVGVPVGRIESIEAQPERRSRSRSGSTASTRFRPTRRPPSCRRRW